MLDFDNNIIAVLLYTTMTLNMYNIYTHMETKWLGVLIGWIDFKF